MKFSETVERMAHFETLARRIVGIYEKAGVFPHNFHPYSFDSFEATTEKDTFLIHCSTTWMNEKQKHIIHCQQAWMDDFNEDDVIAAAREASRIAFDETIVALEGFRIALGCDE